MLKGSRQPIFDLEIAKGSFKKYFRMEQINLIAAITSPFFNLSYKLHCCYGHRGHIATPQLNQHSIPLPGGSPGYRLANEP
jgi:hypothetical protein